MSENIVIIGGGIAGLAAGCYARMNGYGATVFELHDKPGGLCTAWKRKGYVVDGCIHWLVGSGPAVQGLYRAWRELGMLQGREFKDHEIFISIVGKDGKTFNLYTNIDRLEKHMLELSPADSKLIKEFARATRKLARFDLPMGTAPEIQSFPEKALSFIKIAPIIPAFMKYGKTSIQDFAARFKDPFLKWAFAAPFDLPDFPMLAAMMTYAWMNNKSAGYPLGGSMPLARAVEKRLIDLGGRVQYKARVDKVLVEGGRAVGVRLEDGTEHRADIVISAADGHATIFKMLEGKYVDDEIKDCYDNMPRFKSLVQVAFGVDRDMSAEPDVAAYELDQPIDIAGEKEKSISVHNYSYDPSLSPPGKSVLVFRFMSDIGPWREMGRGTPAYEAEKQKITDSITGWLEKKYPGISEQVEMVDVATPLTFERYTANWEGSMEGWMITTKNFMKRLKRTLPGLDNFYMVGQWVMPGGGLPSCAMTAREALQIICKKRGKDFQTSEP